MDEGAITRARTLFSEATVDIDRPQSLMMPESLAERERMRISAVLRRGLADPHRAVRYLAATELARVDPDALPESTINELVNLVDQSRAPKAIEFEPEYQEITDGASIEQDTLLALACLEPRFLDCGLAESVVTRLAEYFRQDRQLYELGHAMLGLSFARSGALVPPELLTDQQRMVLRSLLANSAIWGCDGDLPDMLAERGLPQSRDTVEKLLKDSEMCGR